MTERAFYEEFCDALEYALTAAFKTNPWPEANSFWCDGVVLNQEPVSMPGRFLEGIAFIGVDGQDRYKLRMELGSKAQSLFRTDLSLATSIPKEADDSWINIDPVKKTPNLFLQSIT